MDLEKTLHHDFTHCHHDPAHLILWARRRLKGLEAVQHSGGIFVSVLAQSFVNVSEADGAMLGRVPEQRLRLLQQCLYRTRHIESGAEG